MSRVALGLPEKGFGMKVTRLAAVLAAATLLAHATLASARLVEEKHWLPVKVQDSHGNDLERQIMVTVFYDDDVPKPYPVVIINHGRAVSASDRAALGRAQYSVASQWFTQMGFIVAVPTRIGYGVTGGRDVEYTGECNSKYYPPGYVASAAQTLQVLDFLRARDDVDKARTVIVGQSFGGATSITVAAMNPPGVQMAINFAGGGGGDPKGRPQDPCGPSLLKKMFADYGKTARIPTLWIYTENDMYFGPKLPKTWFDAFKAEGGVGEYELYPALGDNGHGLFTMAPDLWKPRVLAFMRANGYPDLKAPAK